MRVERFRLNTEDAVARLVSAFRARPHLAAFDGLGGGAWSVVVLAGEPLPDSIGDFASLRGALQAAGVLGGAHPAPPAGLEHAPFRGGFVGAIAYECATATGPGGLPPEPWGFPLVAGVVAREYALVDHAAGAVLCVADDPREVGRALARAPHVGRVRPLGPLVRHVPPFVHRARVESLRRWIRIGEVYQANLAHGFTRLVGGDPVDLHLFLRGRHPAPYAGYLALAPRGRFAGGALLSHSPELLLEVDGRRATTRPIKGTAPRSADASEDRERRERLLVDPKERAELAMIVDLERNDLGRVASAGGVRASSVARVESYASVHHLVADVDAELADGVDALGALEALFPGGSVTGAPKFAAMERIASLEREGRGFFTGAFGCLSTCDRATFDVSIRSPLWRPRPDVGVDAGEVSLRVGGGVTWDSVPDAEERETLHKARVFLDAFAGEESAT